MNNFLYTLTAGDTIISVAGNATMLTDRRTSMSYTNSKSTKRFSFGISRNPTAKKAGSNVVTIATLPYEDGQYSVGQTSVTMTVREAKALQGFLNSELSSDDSIDV